MSPPDASASSKLPAGCVAVIFVSRRNAEDPDGYDAASEYAGREAAAMPGYLGVESMRDSATGDGVTISYWQDEAAAIAWRDHAGHSAIRAEGRTRWYESYHVVVAALSRDYRWAR